MVSTRYNVPVDTWEGAVGELVDMLAAVARRGQTTTYSEVTARLRTLRLSPESHVFHALLGDVSRRTFDEGAPLLSAVVVTKDTGRPGGGFYDLARELGFDVPDERFAEDLFWAGHLDEVHRRWRRR
jgi:hypothetical protein